MSTPEDPNPFRSPEVAEAVNKQGSFVSFWITLCVLGVVALALLPVFPGISVILAICLAPGFVHAYVRLTRNARELGMPEPILQLGITLGSIFLVFVMIFATLIVGMVFCMTTITVLDSTSVGEQIIVPLAVMSGIVVPLGIFGVLFAGSLGYFRKKQKATDTMPPEDPTTKPSE